MTPALILLALAPLAYLAGSIPFGLFVGWAKGIDVRRAGSGNIGATNVGRLLGKRFFWIVFILDLLKGLVPTLAAGWVIGFNPVNSGDYGLWLLVAFAAILGHMFSVFLHFKGGKGVSTSAGILLGVWPFFTLPAVVGLTVWFVTFKISRYISLASIVGSISFPLIYVVFGLVNGWPIFGRQWPLLAASLVMAAMIVLKHRGNIARLLSGTENKAPGRAPPPPQS
jgi:glycerol-3-phosphate acyltransferase PlsY